MKNLYHKNKDKGKVYPSPSLFAPNNNNKDALSPCLNLLPAAILALASVLSLEDREVLSYLITRSMKLTNPSTSSSSSSTVLEEKKKCKKTNNNNNNYNNTHKPLFDCDCFDCYTSFWFRWDSSPNRELIHQVIEAFEEHLAKGELSKIKNNNNSRGKKKDKMGRRSIEKTVDKPIKISETPEKSIPMLPAELTDFESVEKSFITDVDIILPLEKEAVDEGDDENEERNEMTGKPTETVVETEQVPVNNSHKGLARKVLPDVLGILNSRLWSLWSPNV